MDDFIGGGLLHRYFHRLKEGDPIAWGLTIIVLGALVGVAFVDKLIAGDRIAWNILLSFVGFTVLITLIAWRISVVHKREDETRKNKWLKKKK